MKTIRAPFDLGEAFTIAVIFLASGAFAPLLFNAATAGELAAGSPVLQALQIAIYAVTAYRAYPLRARIWQMLRTNKPLVLLVLLSIVSCAWSADPALTVRRSVGAALTTLFAVDLAARYSPRKLVALAWVAISLGIGFSVVFQLFFPTALPQGIFADIGVVDDSHAWRGVYSSKNGFGTILALGTIILLAHAGSLRHKRLSLIAGLAAILSLELLAQSRTALVTSLVMALLWPMFTILRWSRRRMSTLGVAIFLTSIPASLLLWTAASAVSTQIDKNSDLTGRTEIWSLCMEAIAKQPLLGYGYSAFWNVTDESAHVRYLLGWDTPYAHNTYIDILLQLGIVGLGVYAALIVLGIARGVRYASRTVTPDGLWPLACLIFTQLYSVTETASFLASGGMFWMLLVSATFSTAVSPEEPELLQDTAFTCLPLRAELEHSCV